MGGQGAGGHVLLCLEVIRANMKIFGQTWKWRPFLEITLILWEKKENFSEDFFGEHIIHLETFCFEHLSRFVVPLP